MNIIPIKRALLSVSNKTKIVDLAKELVAQGIEVISTGGTSELLKKENIKHRSVEEVTQFAEMLEGRVKTLHPKIHGGILGKRDKHQAEALAHHIDWIDLVVVNFYPFSNIANHTTLSWDEAVEYIDIGGPTMIRGAAKNFAWVGALMDPKDYPLVLAELKAHQGLSFKTRQYLAQKVFACTSHYDEMINQFFLRKTETLPLQLNLHLEQRAKLRYGENPHQSAYAYQLKDSQKGILSARLLQGKPLSFNNIIDADAAYHAVKEFKDPACVIIKHANPCGLAIGENIHEAYLRAKAADPKSAFGGIVALNRDCDQQTAKEVVDIFTEVILAPDYAEDALAFFAKKPNLRVLALPIVDEHEDWEMKFITGGALLQERDNTSLSSSDLEVVTQRKPEAQEIAEMLFAWRALKHIKSNAILIAKNNATLGIGAGQVSRIDAVEMAIYKAGEAIKGSILASDAFFPFRDSIDRIAKTGIRAIIQPGGSLRDEEVIAACNEHEIAMVFTGKRCFKH